MSVVFLFLTKCKFTEVNFAVRKPDMGNSQLIKANVEVAISVRVLQRKRNNGMEIYTHMY